MKRLKRKANKEDNDIKRVVEQIKETSMKPVSKKMQKWDSTGITLLDLIMGGGLPWGRIINVVGDTSTGKTYLTIEALAHLYLKVYGKKLKWNYDDAEGGFSFDTNSMYGFNVLKKDQKSSFTVEEMGVRLRQLMEKLKPGQRLIYITDSLDGLPSADERKRDDKRYKTIKSGKDFDEGSYQLRKQKFMSEFFRLRAGEIRKTDVILIIISQVREKIGVMFGEKLSRNGGKALDFYASHCLWLAVVEKIYKKERVIGVTIKARLKKAKISKPFREAYLDIIFDYGMDNIRSNIMYLYDLRTEKGKSRITAKTTVKWNKKEFTVEKLIRYIEKNNLEDELNQKVIDKWEAIEDSISSKRRKNKWA